MSIEPTWTAERIELLKQHFEAGLSCRQIAAHIGVSRNAVIGKISRLDLRREKQGNWRGPEPRRRAPRAKATPRQQFRILRALYDGPEPITDETVPDEAIPSERWCSLLELDEQRCRWPVSSPGEEDFLFCGNFPIDGLPYCAGHARLAYRPDPRQRIARG